MANDIMPPVHAGVTNDLVPRVFEHICEPVKGFSKTYNITKLVYYEVVQEAVAAIAREKQLKAGSRERKVVLIESVNKEWKDLYEEIV